MAVKHPVSVLPGRGIALRRGSSLLLIDADPMKTSATLTDLAQVATEPPPGSGTQQGSRLRSLTKWLLANAGNSPDFAVISTDQYGGLEVFVYGGATARMYVTELASPEIVRGADAGFLVQRSYPSSLYAVAITIDETDPLSGGPIGASGVAPSNIFSLEKGAAPGAGMILWPSASPSTDSDAEIRVVPPMLSVRLDDLEEATHSARSPLPSSAVHVHPPGSGKAWPNRRSFHRTMCWILRCRRRRRTWPTAR